jgi:hypothetical protein
MARLVNGQLVTVASGTQSVGPVRVSNDTIHRVTLRLKRCTALSPLTWPNETTVVSVQVFVSYDNGANYEPAAGFSAIGGVVMDHDGNEAIENALAFTMRPVPQRFLRVDVQVQDGPLVTNVTLEVN